MDTEDKANAEPFLDSSVDLLLDELVRGKSYGIVSNYDPNVSTDDHIRDARSLGQSLKSHSAGLYYVRLNLGRRDAVASVLIILGDDSGLIKGVIRETLEVRDPPLNGIYKRKGKPSVFLSHGQEKPTRSKDVYDQLYEVVGVDRHEVRSISVFAPYTITQKVIAKRTDFDIW